MRAVIGRWGRLLTFAAAMVVAVLLQVLLVDVHHVDPTIWGASVPLFWAALGFAGVIFTAGLAHMAVRYGLHRDHDPYDDGGDADG